MGTEDVISEYNDKVISNNQIVTVFLTSSNRAKYVGEAIKSILNQTYSNFSLVILDNYSKDGSQEIFKKLKSEDSRLILIERKSEILFDNFKYAFSMCRTKYLVVFHDDDIVGETYLEDALSTMERSGYEMLSPLAYYIDEAGKIVAAASDVKTRVYTNDEYLNCLLSTHETGVTFPATIYRTAFYRDIDNFINYEYAGPAGDQLIPLQTERNGGKICILGKRLLYYRIHNEQGSTGNHGVMELKLLHFLLEDDYYKGILRGKDDKMFSYLLYCYKALIRNYIEHNDISQIKQALSINRDILKGFGFKTNAIGLLYHISYRAPALVIRPLGNLLRIRIKKREKSIE